MASSAAPDSSALKLRQFAKALTAVCLGDVFPLKKKRNLRVCVFAIILNTSGDTCLQCKLSNEIENIFMVISSNRELQPPLTKTYECIQPRFVAEEDRISQYLLHTGGNDLLVRTTLVSNPSSLCKLTTADFFG